MDKLSYRRHRFPCIVIQQAVWLYFRFALSYRDVEDMLAERGIDVSYETVRRWALKFGTIIARKLRRGRPRPDGRWHLDEVFVSHQWQTAVRLACRGQRRRGLRYARDREVRPPNCAGSWRSTAAAPSDRRASSAPPIPRDRRAASDRRPRGPGGRCPSGAPEPAPPRAPPRRAVPPARDRSCYAQRR